MRNCAIVCEYNPFHSGHAYQISQAKLRADSVLCVMSGNFVQSGLPAFCDKAIRAECALMGGADAVIELPALYATSGAQFFAEGAVKIIRGIKDISYIAMGATVKPDLIFAAAEIKIKKAEQFSDRLKSLLSLGLSYNIASARAYSELSKVDITSVFQDPNNILCLEYICAIDKFCPNVTPLIIARQGGGHNDLSTTDKYISATAIRSSDLDQVKSYIPFCFDKIKKFVSCHAPDTSAYKKAVMFALKKADENELSELRDCSEGLEYLLKKNSVSDYDKLIDLASGKRYSKKRIARILTALMLGIKKDCLDYEFCTRLLGCKADFDFSILPDCVKSTNAQIKCAAQKSEVAAVLKIDENASALYNTLCGIDGDYYNYSLIKL